MKMKAQVLYGPKDMRLELVDVPELQPGEVRIRVKYTGVCGTDESIYSGDASFWKDGLIRTPMIMGHEFSGVIEAVGERVTRFKPGDRVLSDSMISCGVCTCCRRGDYSECEHQQSLGTVLCKDGSYAEFVNMPERHVYLLPENVSLEQAAASEPIATGMYCCVRAGITFGDTVLVLGTGPIGMGAIQSARVMGASRIVVAARQPMKMAVAKELGADEIIDTTTCDLLETGLALTGGKGFDRVIEATGSRDIFRTGISLTKSCGTISCVAFYDKPVESFDIDALVLGNKTLAGSGGSVNMMEKVIRFMEQGKIDTKPMITGKCTLETVTEVLDNFKANRSKTIKTLIEF